MSWILVSRENPALFIKLEFHKVGKAKGKWRPGWTFTEDFREAFSFPDSRAIDDAQKKHRVPVHILKPLDYATAHLYWTKNFVAP